MSIFFQEPQADDPSEVSPMSTTVCEGDTLQTFGNDHKQIKVVDQGHVRIVNRFDSLGDEQLNTTPTVRVCCSLLKHQSKLVYLELQ